mgnify:FL=1
MKSISIVDYGIGNVLSVKRAFEYVGVEVEFADTAEKIKKAERLVLPGVGAFCDGMAELERRGLVSVIQEYCANDRPFLGICLGMQMMLEESEEFGISKGLGIIPGKVIRIEDTTIEGEYQKIPHVGWNELFYKQDVANTVLDGIPEKERMYFVHSYTAKPSNDSFRLADTYYGGRQISAVIRKGKCYGTQFHPEKSGKVGEQIIKNFIEIKEI